MPDSRRSSRRACDRCSALKERCHWTDNNPTCDRCRRLKHVCSSDRPIRQAGRKPLRGLRVVKESDGGSSPSSVYSSNASVDYNISQTPNSLLRINRPYEQESESKPSLSQSLSCFGDLGDLERHLLTVGLDKQRSLGRYLVGDSFQECHQQAFMTRLYTALPQLKDAFIAATIMFARDVDMQVPGLTLDVYYRRGSSALQSLRAMDITDHQELSISLALAVAMITFTMNIPGGDVLPICRYVLEAFKRSRVSPDSLDSDGFAFLTCLITEETLYCIFWRGVPTIRFASTDPYYVNRYLGISSSLLSYFHDICKLREALHGTEKADTSGTMEAVDELETKVQEWQPSPPPNFLEAYAQTEVMQMLTQAQTLRLTAFLLIHRLRYPYGVENDKAIFISTTIMTELGLVKKLTESGVRCAYLPFVVACSELVDNQRRRQTLETLDDMMGYSTPFHERIKGYLTAFWKVRDEHEGLFWYNIGDHLAPFSSW